MNTSAILAFASGLHPRLGCDSPVYDCLNQHILSHICLEYLRVPAFMINYVDGSSRIIRFNNFNTGDGTIEEAGKYSGFFTTGCDVLFWSAEWLVIHHDKANHINFNNLQASDKSFSLDPTPNRICTTLIAKGGIYIALVKEDHSLDCIHFYMGENFSKKHTMLGISARYSLYPLEIEKEIDFGIIKLIGICSSPEADDGQYFTATIKVLNDVVSLNIEERTYLYHHPTDYHIRGGSCYEYVFSPSVIHGVNVELGDKYVTHINHEYFQFANGTTSACISSTPTRTLIGAISCSSTKKILNVYDFPSGQCIACIELGSYVSRLHLNGFNTIK
jgi:hypothetical protein